MANEEQLAILKQGVDVWNKWHEKNPLIKIDLSNARLDGQNLIGIVLEGAKLRHTSFVGSDLSRAILGFADLDQTDLTNANLFLTNFQASVLTNAKITNARMAYTIFGATDFGGAKGLESIKHEAGSALDTLTIRKSSSSLPAIFLRGCGLSDWEIESAKLYNPDLTNDEIAKIQYRIYELRATQAIQISPLFISYSHQDKPFVDKMDAALAKKGVRFWRDIHDATAGRLETQIDRAIRQNPTVLLILSKNSIKSDWVEHEATEARRVEKEIGRDVLCPITLDDSWETSSPWSKQIMEQIKKYNILDFSKWENDSVFEEQFAKLLNGLDLFYKKPN